MLLFHFGTHCIVTFGRMNLFAVALAFSSFNNDGFASVQSNTFLSQLQPWPSFHLLRILIPLLPLLFHLSTYLLYGLYKHPTCNKAILLIVPQALRVPKPAHFCSRVCSWSRSVMLSLFLHSFWWAAGFGHGFKPASGTDLEVAECWVLTAALFALGQHRPLVSQVPVRQQNKCGFFSFNLSLFSFSYFTMTAATKESSSRSPEEHGKQN